MGFFIYSQQCLVVCFHKEVYSWHITEMPSAESSHSLVNGMVLDSFHVEAKLNQSACLFFGHVNQIQNNSEKGRILKILKILKFLQIFKLRLCDREEGISDVGKWLHEPPALLDVGKSLL